MYALQVKRIIAIRPKLKLYESISEVGVEKDDLVRCDSLPCVPATLESPFLAPERSV